MVWKIIQKDMGGIEMNQVVLIGRITKDIELKYTQTGKCVCSFTVAVNKGFGKDSEADFINCVAWEKTAENLANYTAKGSQVGISGRLQVRSYDSKEGKKVYVTEVVANFIEFIGTKSDQSQKPKQESPVDDFEVIDEEDFDQDLPF